MFLFSLLDFPVLFECCISMSYLYSGRVVVFVLEKLNRLSDYKR